MYTSDIALSELASSVNPDVVLKDVVTISSNLMIWHKLGRLMIETNPKYIQQTNAVSYLSSSAHDIVIRICKWTGLQFDLDSKKKITIVVVAQQTFAS